MNHIRSRRRAILIRALKFALPGAFLFFSPWAPPAAQESRVENAAARIDSVTIFTDRAAVRRTQTIRLEAGQKTLRFVDLPQAAAADSIRASAQGVEIASVAVRPASRAEDPTLADHPLKRRMTSLEAAIRGETDKQSNYREQLKVLGSFGQIGAGQADRDIRQNANAVPAMADLLRFLEKNRSEYFEKIQKSEQEASTLRLDLKNVAEQFARLTMSRQRSALEVDIVCQGRAGAAGSITLEYTVTGVSWKGIYDLHGSSDGGDFRLDVRAAVRQATGEDWKNVQITLSTARPSSGLGPGALKPWRISGANLWTMSREEDKKEEGQDRASGGRGTETSEGASFTILLPERETISSDNSDHRITLKSTALKGTVEHVAKPSLSSYVFLKAMLRNTSTMPLVWGTMNIFLDGSFAGSTVPARAAVGEEFEVYLGPDQRMTVERTLLKGDVAAGGILSNKVRIENQWQIQITNHGKKSRRVVVYDRYPVARDPAIATTFTGSSRRDLKPDAHGILTLPLDVGPGASSRFDFSYSLEIPQETWQRFQEVSPQAPAPAAEDGNAPAKARRMYDLERMLQH